MTKRSPRGIVTTLAALASIVGAAPRSLAYYRRPGISKRVSITFNGGKSISGTALPKRGALLGAPTIHLLGLGEKVERLRRWPRHGSLSSAIFGLSVVLFTTAPGSAYTRPEKTSLISVSSSGAPAEADDSYLSFREVNPVISRSARYIAFVSDASNFTSGLDNGELDVFRHDRFTGETELVSMKPTGEQSACYSLFPAISGNGRFIAFWSCDAHLAVPSVRPIPGQDVEIANHVYVRDMRTGVTKQVDVSWDATPNVGSAFMGPLSITSDGRFVAFDHTADDLVQQDTNDRVDVFRRDLKLGHTVLVSANSAGEQAEGGSSNASISSNDGRFIAFVSGATNLEEGDSDENLFSDGGVFVKDLETGEVELITAGTNGERRDSIQLTIDLRPAISADGRFVAFRSVGRNQVPNDSNGPDAAKGADVFVFDRVKRRMERVSVSSVGAEGDSQSGSNSVGISSSGRYVVFDSNASNWFQGEPVEAIDGLSSSPGDPDIFIYDRLTGTTDWLSVTPDGQQGDGQSTGLSVTDDGRYVPFVSEASNLVAGDTNRISDTFLRDRGSIVGTSVLTRSGRLSIAGSHRFQSSGVLSRADSPSDVGGHSLDPRGDLISARLVYRPALEDLFVVEDLEELDVHPNESHAASVVDESIHLYGLRFRIADKQFEARSTSTLGGTFELFECDDSYLTCTGIASLEGGYGTTGERVVFSLPLTLMDLENGGTLSHIVAFSGIGSHGTGAIKVIDTLRLDKIERPDDLE